MKTIIITRHTALVEYILEQGIAPEGTEAIPHASAEDIAGNRVIGPLPIHLAALAYSVVSVPLDIPIELRGTELSLEQVRQFAKPHEEYFVFNLRDSHDDVWDIRASKESILSSQRKEK